MSAKFRNTTALVAAFSLAIPAVAPAQQVVERCEAGTIGISAEVAEELELTLSDEQAAALEGGAASDAVIMSTFNDAPELCMTMAELEEMGVTEADVTMAVEAQTAPEEMGATAEAEVEAEEPGLLEQAVDALTGDEPEAEAGAEAEVAEVPAEVEAEAEAEVSVEPEMAEAEPEEEAEPEMAEADVEAEVEAEAEPEMAEAEAEEEVTAEGGSLQEALDDVTGNEEGTSAETETVAEAEAEAEVEAEAEASAEAAPEPAPEMEEMAEAIEEQSAEEADPEQQAAAAETEAPSQSAAAEEDAEVTEVEEVTVTEDNARSSSEEFEQKVTGAATASAETRDNDGGLSDLEKALLVGLGAVVVGKALEGNDKAQVVAKSDDRVVVLEEGRYRVIRDDNELIERPGSTVRRETFADGSTRTIVTRENGVQIVTIRDPELRVLRRVRIDTDGNRTVLIDDTADVEPVDVTTLPDPVEYEEVDARADADTIRAALSTKTVADRRFALYQVRNIERVRKLAPAIDLDAINFRTGSAVIDPQEAEELAALGNLIRAYVDENPGEIFLVEGHTDAVGNAAYNLALSDRRAESVALALTEYFDVPPENLVVQGYGESDLKIKTLDDERANRRAAVRRITPLIASGS